MNEEFSYICTSQKNYTPEISLLIFEPVGEKLPYVSGQYVEIALGNEFVLPLSIANAPSMDGHLEFHLRHYQQKTPAHEALLHEIAKGRPMRFYGPKGNSTLDKVNPTESLIFLAGGTGFGPIKALLETALHSSKNPALTLYWGVRRPEDAYEIDLLKHWKEKFPQFHYTLVLSEMLFSQWTGATGLVHEYCAKLEKDFSRKTVFASGPYEMIQAAFKDYCQLGLGRDQFVSDMLG